MQTSSDIRPYCRLPSWGGISTVSMFHLFSCLLGGLSHCAEVVHSALSNSSGRGDSMCTWAEVSSDSFFFAVILDPLLGNRRFKIS